MTHESTTSLLRCVWGGIPTEQRCINTKGDIQQTHTWPEIQFAKYERCGSGRGSTQQLLYVSREHAQCPLLSMRIPADSRYWSHFPKVQSLVVSCMNLTLPQQTVISSIPTVKSGKGPMRIASMSSTMHRLFMVRILVDTICRINGVCGRDTRIMWYRTPLCSI